jgi:membrane protease subunit HflK
VVPRAKGEAASIVQRAEAYKATTVARARGDAQRFDQVYEQYNKAKDITAERLYLETIEEVLRNTTKVMVEKNGTATGVLPYLSLPDLRQPAPPAPPRQAPAPGPTQGQGGTR